MPKDSPPTTLPVAPTPMVDPLRQFEPVAEAIAKLLHPFAEVVIHDIAANRIAAIYNSFSRRQVGDDSKIQDASGLAGGPDVHGPFQQRELDGRRLKYVSVVLRAGDGRAIGLLCVNLEVGPLEAVQEALAGLLSAGSDSASLDLHFREDWSERIVAFVRNYLRERARSLDSLDRDEKAQLVRALQDAGAFRAKNAASIVAEALGVSRATVYNYLAKVDHEGERPAGGTQDTPPR